MNGIKLARLPLFVYYVLCRSQMFHVRCCRLTINHYSCECPQTVVHLAALRWRRKLSDYDAFCPSGCAGELVPNRGMGAPKAPNCGLL
jgi:hypothetical protein